MSEWLTDEQRAILPEWAQEIADGHTPGDATGTPCLHAPPRGGGDGIDAHWWPCDRCRLLTALADALLAARPKVIAPEPWTLCPVCGEKAVAYVWPMSGPDKDNPDMSCSAHHWWTRSDTERLAQP